MVTIVDEDLDNMPDSLKKPYQVMVKSNDGFLTANDDYFLGASHEAWFPEIYRYI